MTSDYNFLYDDDDDLSSVTENINLENDFEVQPFPEDVNVDELLKGGDFTKPADSGPRSKRNVVASTADGVPIISNAYADDKKINRTRTLNLYSKIMPKGGDGVHTSIPKLNQGYQR